MTQTLEAVFDGDVLRPDEPLQLAPNTRVRLVIETVAPAKEAKSFLATAQALNLAAPPIGRKTWTLIFMATDE